MQWLRHFAAVPEGFACSVHSLRMMIATPSPLCNWVPSWRLGDESEVNMKMCFCSGIVSAYTDMYVHVHVPLVKWRKVCAVISVCTVTWTYINVDQLSAQGGIGGIGMRFRTWVKSQKSGTHIKTLHAWQKSYRSLMILSRGFLRVRSRCTTVQ